MSACPDDSQADGYKIIEECLDNQADGHKGSRGSGCDYRSGEGCSESQKRLIKGNQPMESQPAHLLAGSFATVIVAKALAVRTAIAMLPATETGQGILGAIDGAKDALSPGPAQGPTLASKSGMLGYGAGYILMTRIKQRLGIP